MSRYSDIDLQIADAVDYAGDAFDNLTEHDIDDLDAAFKRTPAFHVVQYLRCEALMWREAQEEQWHCYQRAWRP